MWYNVFMEAVLRSPLHSLISKNFMLLTYTGRKSGKPYSLPVNYYRMGDSLLVTSLRSRTWWRSMRNGAPVELILQGKRISTSGEALEAEGQVAAGLEDLFCLYPTMARFFDVRMAGNQRPEPEDLIAAARSRVVVRFKLPA